MRRLLVLTSLLVAAFAVGCTASPKEEGAAAGAALRSDSRDGGAPAPMDACLFGPHPRNGTGAIWMLVGPQNGPAERVDEYEMSYWHGTPFSDGPAPLVGSWAVTPVEGDATKYAGTGIAPTTTAMDLVVAGPTATVTVAGTATDTTGIQRCPPLD